MADVTLTVDTKGNSEQQIKKLQREVVKLRAELGKTAQESNKAAGGGSLFGSRPITSMKSLVGLTMKLAPGLFLAKAAVDVMNASYEQQLLLLEKINDQANKRRESLLETAFSTGRTAAMPQFDQAAKALGPKGAELLAVAAQNRGLDTDQVIDTAKAGRDFEIFGDNAAKSATQTIGELRLRNSGASAESLQDMAAMLQQESGPDGTGGLFNQVRNLEGAGIQDATSVALAAQRSGAQLEPLLNRLLERIDIKVAARGEELSAEDRAANRMAGLDSNGRLTALQADPTLANQFLGDGARDLGKLSPTAIAKARADLAAADDNNLFRQQLGITTGTMPGLIKSSSQRLEKSKWDSDLSHEPAAARNQIADKAFEAINNLQDSSSFYRYQQGIGFGFRKRNFGEDIALSEAAGFVDADGKTNGEAHKILEQYREMVVRLDRLVQQGEEQKQATTKRAVNVRGN